MPVVEDFQEMAPLLGVSGAKPQSSRFAPKSQAGSCSCRRAVRRGVGHAPLALD